MWGFFKKVVLADRLAIVVNQVYNNTQDYEGTAFIVATIFFAFQIYCDFSAYSDIARGSARMLGFDLMKNFNTPYFSASIGEFWRRWHISLSTWFRDYLYIPLGGNKVVKWRWYYNLFITFLVSGLWHGANWTFIIWGALHGLYLIIGTRISFGEDRVVFKPLRVLFVFALVCYGWVYFRANSIEDALYITQHMFSSIDLSFIKPDIDSIYNLLVLAVNLPLLIVIEFVSTKKDILAYLSSLPTVVRWGVYWGLLLVILFGGMYVNPSTFIYFQF